ncbi:hypothetical protein P153DRAFT_413502 [Dothidotthia symphoricarpi CBS 119687]|uniref:Uncharacterized protein n=1 Tax=Dothidotthia symphoricarpi CBS 119687 TaxID=1392245 RepID=A0A6A5ZV73_9PLEO|nr:uncharacterized protein P153DRAFT_413502 [Dothidotthia symphoricarpi CBS 119687]KAF2123540.1 hypothetical protein P153DRAFT_413502 [Dothidotthia symphoricarpi CBS 119687]
MRLDNLTMSLPAELPHVPPKLEDYVNSELSCSFGYECVAPRAQKSRFCARHGLIIIELAESDEFGPRCLSTFVAYEGVVFSLPRDSAKAAIVKGTLRRLRSAKPADVWLGDSEGIVYKEGLAVLHTEVELVNLRGPIWYITSTRAAWETE